MRYLGRHSDDDWARPALGETIQTQRHVRKVWILVLMVSYFMQAVLIGNGLLKGINLLPTLAFVVALVVVGEFAKLQIRRCKLAIFHAQRLLARDEERDHHWKQLGQLTGMVRED